MPRYPHFEGVNRRILERIVAIGFTRSDGQPDITRFTAEFNYDPRRFYPWINPTKPFTPTPDTLKRLAKDLACDWLWLLSGDPRLAPEDGSDAFPPIAGSSGAPLPVVPSDRRPASDGGSDADRPTQSAPYRKYWTRRLVVFRADPLPLLAA